MLCFQLRAQLASSHDYFGAVERERQQNQKIARPERAGMHTFEREFKCDDVCDGIDEGEDEDLGDSDVEDEKDKEKEKEDKEKAKEKEVNALAQRPARSALLPAPFSSCH